LLEATILHQEHPLAGSADPGPLSRRAWALLGIICMVALLLRLHVGIPPGYVIHPDETFDYLEQGFRLAIGNGVQVWTYEDGVRSYLFSALLAAAMKLGALLGPRPASVLDAAAVFMSLMSLSIVVVAFLWGRRAAGCRR
jgi:hypothetical protein